MANDVTLYTDGTVTFTLNSAAIVGVSTAFLSLVPGDPILGADGKWYELKVITDDTHATLNKNYAGATAAGAAVLIFKSSLTRDSARNASKQLSSITDFYRRVTNLTSVDSYFKFSKAATANNAGMIVQRNGTDLFRMGVFGNDNFEIQWLNSSTWQAAFSINPTTGVFTLPTTIQFTGLLSVQPSEATNAFQFRNTTFGGTGALMNQLNSGHVLFFTQDAGRQLQLGGAGSIQLNLLAASVTPGIPIAQFQDNNGRPPVQFFAGIDTTTATDGTAGAMLVRQAAGTGRSITTVGSIWSFNSITSAGVNSGLFFWDRSTDRRFGWYAASDVARLFNGSSDVLTITTGGVLQATSYNLGGGAALWQNGVNTVISAIGDSAKSIYVGSNGFSIHDNTFHFFRASGGSPNFLVIDNTGVLVYPTTASTSTTTGSGRFSGGIGVAGAGWFGGQLHAAGGIAVGVATGGGSRLIALGGQDIYVSYCNQNNTEAWALGFEGSIGSRFALFSTAISNYPLLIAQSGIVDLPYSLRIGATQNGGITVAPTGNPGNTQSWLTTQVTSAAGNANNREFVLNVGYNAFHGAGGSAGNDKVVAYFGMVANAGAAACWPLNTVFTAQAGWSGPGRGYECDMNNLTGVHRDAFDGNGIYGIDITGNGYRCTSAILVSNANANPSSNPLFNFGISFVLGAINTATIYDGTNSVYSMLIEGSHSWGIDTAGATFAGYAIRLRSGQVIGALNSSGTLNRTILQMAGDAYCLLGDSGMIVAPYADNSLYCGDGPHRWIAVYAVNGTIQTSSITRKHVYGDNPLGLAFVRALRAVDYRYHEDDEGVHRYGLILEQLQDVLAGRAFAGILQDGLNYSELIAPLITSVQTLADNDNRHDLEIAALKARVLELETQLAA
jgi:hypothetical protein